MQLGPGWFIFIDHTGRPQDEKRAKQRIEWREKQLEKRRREDEEAIILLLLEADEI